MPDVAVFLVVAGQIRGRSDRLPVPSPPRNYSTATGEMNSTSLRAVAASELVSQSYIGNSKTLKWRYFMFLMAEVKKQTRRRLKPTRLDAKVGPVTCTTR